MTRVLKRPMFRIGGPANEGITSGLAPRQGYQTGNTVEDYKRILGEAAGKRPDRSLSNFLIDFGLNVAGATPSGSIFSTAAKSAQEPFQRYQTSKAEHGAFDRKLGLSAATMALEHEQAQKLKMMGDKTDFGKIRKEARDMVNLGLINPATNEVYTEAEAYERAIELAETSPGKAPRDRWDNIYTKHATSGLVEDQVAQNKATWIVYLKDNVIASGKYGGSAESVSNLVGKGATAEYELDPTQMDPHLIYWDEEEGILWQVVELEDGTRKVQEVPNWQREYDSRTK
jgi:hypothetical protein